jgi:hypothetical protein
MRYANSAFATITKAGGEFWEMPRAGNKWVWTW